MAMNDYLKYSIMGIAGGVVVGGGSALFLNLYKNSYQSHNPSFIQDFIAKGTEFNRPLTIKEKPILSGFPNAKVDSVTFLGIGAIRPSEESCEQYHCVASPVHLYDAKTQKYVGTMTVTSSQVDLMQIIWDKCNSGQYKCSYEGHFGATYNCIGWAVGVSKWLDPREITVKIVDGMNRDEAINSFLADQSQIYHNNHASNIDSLVDRLHAIDSLTLDNITNNTVAFYFDANGQCQHGARYLETLTNNPLNRWTSKLGSSITVAHELDDLLGENSIYGNELHYAAYLADNITPMKGEL